VAESILTPLQLIAGASLSNNQGIQLAPDFANALASYNGTPLINPLLIALGNSSAANLSNVTLLGLETMAANTCPALADNTPANYAPAIGSSLGNPALGNSILGFTGIIGGIGNSYLGNGNVSVFSQVFAGAVGYIDQTNAFINTAINSQTYLGSTFTSMNSLITGNLTDVNLALPWFGSDLARLGFLIDLTNLGNFGLPSLVFKQLATVTNLTARITVALRQVGFSTSQIERITDPDARLTDTEEARLYRAMLLITGQALQQVCDILKITLPVASVNTTQPQNPGLNSMADLLNPVKIFPNSFASLTVRTYNQNTTSELRSIYLDATGNVNSKLTEYLPRYVITVVPA
jgi:hypothetical protein